MSTGSMVMLLWRCVMSGDVKATGERVPDGWLALPNTQSEVQRYGLCPDCREKVWQAEMKQRAAVSNVRVYPVAHQESEGESQ